MKVDAKFEKWAKSLIGCDGGAIDAEIYFCGIEWGGESAPDLYPFEYSYQMGDLTVPAREINKVSTNPQYTKHNFDQKIAKIMLAAYPKKFAGLKYKEFIQQLFCMNPGPLFKLNLYPFNFKSHHDNLWTKEHFDRTGIPTKPQYRAWCIENRFPLFQQIVEKFKPKLIVCFGLTYRHDYVLAFGGAELIFKKNHKQISIAGRKIEIIKVSDKTHIVIAPFLSGAAGLNSNEILASLGQKLRAFL